MACWRRSRSSVTMRAKLSGVVGRATSSSRPASQRCLKAVIGAHRPRPGVHDVNPEDLVGAVLAERPQRPPRDLVAEGRGARLAVEAHGGAKDREAVDDLDDPQIVGKGDGRPRGLGGTGELGREDEVPLDRLQELLQLRADVQLLAPAFGGLDQGADDRVRHLAPHAELLLKTPKVSVYRQPADVIPPDRQLDLRRLASLSIAGVRPRAQEGRDVVGSAGVVVVGRQRRGDRAQIGALLGALDVVGEGRDQQFLARDPPPQPRLAGVLDALGDEGGEGLSGRHQPGAVHLLERVEHLVPALDRVLVGEQLAENGQVVGRQPLIVASDQLREDRRPHRSGALGDPCLRHERPTRAQVAHGRAPGEDLRVVLAPLEHLGALEPVHAGLDARLLARIVGVEQARDRLLKEQLARGDQP